MHSNTTISVILCGNVDMLKEKQEFSVGIFVSISILQILINFMRK